MAFERRLSRDGQEMDQIDKYLENLDAKLAGMQACPDESMQEVAS